MFHARLLASRGSRSPRHLTARLMLACLCRLRWPPRRAAPAPPLRRRRPRRGPVPHRRRSRASTGVRRRRGAARGRSIDSCPAGRDGSRARRVLVGGARDAGGAGRTTRRRRPPRRDAPAGAARLPGGDRRALRARAGAGRTLPGARPAAAGALPRHPARRRSRRHRRPDARLPAEGQGAKELHQQLLDRLPRDARGVLRPAGRRAAPRRLQGRRAQASPAAAGRRRRAESPGRARLVGARAPEPMAERGRADDAAAERRPRRAARARRRPPPRGRPPSPPRRRQHGGAPAIWIDDRQHALHAADARWRSTASRWARSAPRKKTSVRTRSGPHESLRPARLRRPQPAATPGPSARPTSTKAGRLTSTATHRPSQGRPVPPASAPDGVNGRGEPDLHRRIEASARDPKCVPD